MTEPGSENLAYSLGVAMDVLLLILGDYSSYFCCRRIVLRPAISPTCPQSLPNVASSVDIRDTTDEGRLPA